MNQKHKNGSRRKEDCGSVWLNLVLHHHAITAILSKIITCHTVRDDIYIYTWVLMRTGTGVGWGGSSSSSSQTCSVGLRGHGSAQDTRVLRLQLWQTMSSWSSPRAPWKRFESLSSHEGKLRHYIQLCASDFVATVLGKNHISVRCQHAFCPWSAFSEKTLPVRCLDTQSAASEPVLRHVFHRYQIATESSVNLALIQFRIRGWVNVRFLTFFFSGTQPLLRSVWGAIWRTVTSKTNNVPFNKP